MQIVIDDLSGAEIRALLQFHVDEMHIHSPADSCHALDLDELRHPSITFWTAWDKDELLGCAAIKALDDMNEKHAELKSMRTAPAHLRRGVAKAMLMHIIREAKTRGYTRLSLETGTPKAFVPAQKLYEACGFTYCAPFADYVLDPYSVFMTKQI